VAPLRVVEHLDVVEDITPRFFPITVDSVACESLRDSQKRMLPYWHDVFVP